MYSREVEQARSMDRQTAPSALQSTDSIAHKGIVQPVALWTTITSWIWLLPSIVCAWLGYLLVWQRGMFFDDYAVRKFAVDITTGEWHTFSHLTSRPNFPGRFVNWLVMPWLAALLQDHELFAHILVTLSIGLNALLLGLLVGRMLQSRLAAVIAAWLFLMPVFTDVALWVSAADSPFAMTLMLIFLHSFWNSLIQPQHELRWITVGTLSFFVALSMKESFVSSIGIVLLIGIIYKAQFRPSFTSWIWRLTRLLLWPCLALVIYFIIISQSTVVTTRQGFTTDPHVVFQHILAFAKELWFWTVAPDWGWTFIREAFSDGLQVIGRSRQGVVLLAAALGLLVLTVATWRSDDRPTTGSTSYHSGVFVVGLGVIWFAVTLWFPYALVNVQMYFERRFVYPPTAGLCICVAALAWILCRAGRASWERWLVALAGIELLLTTVCTVGLAQAYQDRSRLDQQQITGLTRILPAAVVPSGAQILPIMIDEHLPERRGIFTTLSGVFESSWSACAAFEAAYRRDDFQVIVSNRWAPPQVSVTTESHNSPKYLDCRYQPTIHVPSQSPQAKLLYIQGRYIDPEQAILLTYQNGQAQLIESLTITDMNGSQQRVEFPIARTLRAAGTPSIDTVELPNQAWQLGSPDGWD